MGAGEEGHLAPAHGPGTATGSTDEFAQLCRADRGKLSFSLSSWRGKREKKEGPWLEKHAQKPSDGAPGLPAPQQVKYLFGQEHSLCHRSGLSLPQLEECIYGPLKHMQKSCTAAVGLGVSSRHWHWESPNKPLLAQRGRAKSCFNHTSE